MVRDRDVEEVVWINAGANKNEFASGGYRLVSSLEERLYSSRWD
jgi:hypothetical protein